MERQVRGVELLSSKEKLMAGLPNFATYTRSLDRAIETWKGARRHFEVTLGPPEVQRRVGAKLAWLPALERRHWRYVMAERSEVQDSLTFLALSLDTNGRPIPVVNTDPATELFLADTMSAETMQVDLAPFLRAFPVGLLVDGLGPLVANDAYATPAIWERFREDTYHGPRVVWGREVNLFLLGLANQILRGRDDKKRSLGYALKEVLAAVYSSGLQHNELWSYEFRGRALVPVRYGTSSDVQLWNTTHLAVEFVLSQLPVMSP